MQKFTVRSFLLSLLAITAALSVASAGYLGFTQTKENKQLAIEPAAPSTLEQQNLRSGLLPQAPQLTTEPVAETPAAAETATEAPKSTGTTTAPTTTKKSTSGSGTTKGSTGGSASTGGGSTGGGGTSTGGGSTGGSTGSGGGTGGSTGGGGTIGSDDGGSGDTGGSGGTGGGTGGGGDTGGGGGDTGGGGGGEVDGTLPHAYGGNFGQSTNFYLSYNYQKVDGVYEKRMRVLAAGQLGNINAPIETVSWYQDGTGASFYGHFTAKSVTYLLKADYALVNGIRAAQFTVYNNQSQVVGQCNWIRATVFSFKWGG